MQVFISPSPLFAVNRPLPLVQLHYPYNTCLAIGLACIGSLSMPLQRRRVTIDLTA